LVRQPLLERFRLGCVADAPECFGRE